MSKPRTARNGRRRSMGSWMSESGKSSIRGLLALGILVGVVYVGMMFLPVRAAAYQFEDAIRDEVVLAGGRRRPTDADIKRSLIGRAVELGLPIESGDITIRRSGRTYIVVEAKYSVTIELVGGYKHVWSFTPKAEGPLF